MRLHEKIADIRDKKGFSQKQFAKKLHMSKEGYGKLERGERQLKFPRLQQIATALEMELQDILVDVDENMVFKGPFHDDSCQRNYVNSTKTKETGPEVEKLRLLLEQKEREMELLREQEGQLKEIIELMRK